MTRITALAICFFLALTSGACTQTGSSGPSASAASRPPPTPEQIAAAKQFLDELAATVTRTTIQDAQAHLSNQTKMTYDRGHGTQVEYTSADGKAYLWYPGNRIVLPGEWKAEMQSKMFRGEQRDIAHICFRYGGNTYNPVTGHSGGGWECSYAGLSMRSSRENVSGDVLGLAGRGPVPFVLSRDPTTLSELKARVAASGR